jgi:DNA-directed RNA polymerase
MLEENHSWSLGNDVLKEVDAGDGKPALFAAACREWYELFMAPSPKTTTDLIVSNDCSCSGQQFAAGWRRSKTLARATNCIESDEIHDLYSDVYKNMMERILCDEAGNISTRHEREMRLKGLGRSIVKGGIQPSMYGAGEETAITGVKAKIDKFSKKGLKLSDVERALIVNHYQPAVNEVCEMNTMNQWFREVARALGDNKAESILIPTPVGDTIEIVYSQLKGMKVSTFRYGTQRYKAKTKSVTLVEPNGKPDVKKWVSSLSANTTHGAGDASQLCLALNDAPFDFVTCHDSVGCAAPHMNELRRRMKEAYVKVVSFPLFDEILKANNLVAGQKMVNPIIGDWDPTEALRSTYLLS